METDSSGNAIALVVQLQLADDGLWHLLIDGSTGSQSFPLAPATLIVRLWRNAERGILRGNIRLHGSNVVAPIQLNTQIETLLRVWLSQGGASPSNQQVPPGRV